jgi:hypothetical protein
VHIITTEYLIDNCVGIATDNCNTNINCIQLLVLVLFKFWWPKDDWSGSVSLMLLNSDLDMEEDPEKLGGEEGLEKPGGPGSVSSSLMVPNFGSCPDCNSIMDTLLGTS